MEKDIKEKIEIVKNDILNRFPNCSYTIIVTLWDDNTNKIECRHGNDECTKIYVSTYYNDKLTFEEIDISHDTIMIRDKYGKNNYKYLRDK